MQKEQVIYRQEGDWVHETLGIQETLEIVVFFVLLNVFFKFVDIEVPLSMPLFVLKILYICDSILACEA